MTSSPCSHPPTPPEGFRNISSRNAGSKHRKQNKTKKKTLYLGYLGMSHHHGNRGLTAQLPTSLQKSTGWYKHNTHQLQSAYGRAAPTYGLFCVCLMNPRIHRHSQSTPPLQLFGYQDGRWQVLGWKSQHLSEKFRDFQLQVFGAGAQGKGSEKKTVDAVSLVGHTPKQQGV